MENWAAYLRGQADAPALEVINSSGVPAAVSATRLRRIVESLLARGIADEGEGTETSLGAFPAGSLSDLVAITASAERN